MNEEVKIIGSAVIEKKSVTQYASIYSFGIDGGGWYCAGLFDTEAGALNYFQFMPQESRKIIVKIDIPI